MAKVTVKNLQKAFGNQKVLYDLSFAVEDGKFLSLLGPSGCGKSTTLRIISGLDSPDAGSVLVNGEDVTKLPPEKRNIGMVFQNYALFPSMTVAKNVGYGLKMRRIRPEEIEEKVQSALELVRLRGYENRKITKLSGGEQQRVALARALVIEPSILLLDEPLSALDRKIRTEMQYEIRAIQQKTGITTIFVTHDQEEALTMSDEILLFNKGRIEQLADPWTLYNQPVSIFASDFLGKANLLNATLTCEGKDWYVIGNGWRLPVVYRNGKNQEKVKVAIRGEHFMIDSQPHEGWSSFVISRKIFTGMIFQLIGRMGNDKVEVSSMGIQSENYNEGDTVYISSNPRNTLYFPI